MMAKSVELHKDRLRALRHLAVKREDVCPPELTMEEPSEPQVNEASLPATNTCQLQMMTKLAQLHRARQCLQVGDATNVTNSRVAAPDSSQLSVSRKSSQVGDATSVINSRVAAPDSGPLWVSRKASQVGDASSAINSRVAAQDSGPLWVSRTSSLCTKANTTDTEIEPQNATALLVKVAESSKEGIADHSLQTSRRSSNDSRSDASVAMLALTGVRHLKCRPRRAFKGQSADQHQSNTDALIIRAQSVCNRTAHITQSPSELSWQLGLVEESKRVLEALEELHMVNPTVALLPSPHILASLIFMSAPPIDELVTRTLCGWH